MDVNKNQDVNIFKNLKPPLCNSKWKNIPRDYGNSLSGKKYMQILDSLKKLFFIFAKKKNIWNTIKHGGYCGLSALA